MGLCLRPAADHCTYCSGCAVSNCVCPCVRGYAAAAHFSQQRYSGGSAAEIAGAGCCFGTGDSRNAVCRNQAAGGADPAHSHAGPAAHSSTDAAPCGQQPTGTVQAGRNPVCSPPLFRLLAADVLLQPGKADQNWAAPRGTTGSVCCTRRSAWAAAKPGMRIRKKTRWCLAAIRYGLLCWIPPAACGRK